MMEQKTVRKANEGRRTFPAVKTTGRNQRSLDLNRPFQAIPVRVNSESPVNTRVREF